MKNLYIRPITLEDTDNIVKWRNSAEVKCNLFSQAELTPEQHKNYFKNNIKTGKCHQFIIVADDFSIGTVFLKNIDLNEKKAEFGIFIGESSARGRGYSSQATRLIVDYGFFNLGLEKIELSVFVDNIPAVRAYKKVGFKEDRIQKNAVDRSIGSTDVLLMSVSKDEWMGHCNNDDMR